MLFSRASKKDVSFVCDIGSDTVSCAFVEFSDTPDRPLVLKTFTCSLSKKEKSLKAHLGPKKLLKLCFEDVITRASKYAHEHSLSKPTLVHCTFAAPWYASESHQESIHKDNPEIFTRDMFANLVRDAGDELIKKSKDTSKSFKDYFDSGSHVIEKHSVSLMVNGYHVKNPFDKAIRDLNVSFYLTVIPVDVHRFVNEIIQSMWSDTAVSMSSFALTHYAVAKRKDFLTIENTAHIDVTGSATEITLISGGSLINTVHIPIGKAHFRNRIEKGYGLESYMASSLFDLYVKKELSRTESANISFLLSDIENEWKSACAKLNTTHKSVSYVLSADRSYIEYFKSLLLKSAHNEDLKDAKENVAGIERYNNFVNYQNQSDVDPFLSLSVAFTHNS